MSMPEIVKFHDEDFGYFYVEVTDVPERTDRTKGMTNASNDEGIKHFEVKMDQVLGSLKTFGRGVLHAVKDLKPDELEVKGGLNLEFKEGKLISYIAQAKADFSFEVTLKWKFDQKDSETA